MINTLREFVPHGNTLDDEAWRKRHRLLLWVLTVHVPGMFLFGLVVGRSVAYTGWAVALPLACVLAGWAATRRRRLGSFLVTVGLTYCSAALVGLSGGSIEAHFHFFIMIGFIALYQDWFPFLWNIAFTVLSHGIGSWFSGNLIFNHPAAQGNPWLWSGIHGAAVLAGCGGVVIFWKVTEDEQRKTISLRARLADEELARRKFTAEMLVNLARRNQSLLYRQLDVINQMEEHETDPDALDGLFKLDHLATRIRRNAENLLVLSGERPPRTWSQPVPLVDIVRAAIAETEDLERVTYHVDDRLAIFGNAVADLTHLLAELVENAVRFSPPHTKVGIMTRPRPQGDGAYVLTVEDWGVGMPPQAFADANDLLATPREVDLSMSQRLGLHVVARLARRLGIGVSLTPTPGGGVTAVAILPPTAFTEAPRPARPQPQPRPPVPPARHLAGRGAPPATEPRAVAPPTPPASPFTEPPAPTPAPVSVFAGAAPGAAGRNGFAGERHEPGDPWSKPPTPPYANGSAPPQLQRRVPQAHLVPELRRPVQAPAPAPAPAATPVLNAAQTRAALSRYQASRAAALSAMDSGAVDRTAPIRPDGGDGE